MAWRRAVRDAKGTDRERDARDRVQAAKVALGERGTPWWEQTDGERRERWRHGLRLAHDEGFAPPDQEGSA